MSDDNSRFDLTRRKVLGGLGGVGAGAALGGTGTMAFLNDTETTTSSVTAGELDLKLGWKNFYYGKELDINSQSQTDDPGPMYTISDAKPGDCGGGCISLGVHDNPAYIWAACDMAYNAENGVNDPESQAEGEDDDYGENSGDNWSGELAENIEVALLRFPLAYDSNDIESEAGALKTAVRGGGEVGKSEFQEIQSGCSPIFYNTTLKELCKGPLHNGYLLDGGDALDVSTSGNSEHDKCFQPSETYWYCFLWWIPTSVGNEIQSDGVEFDLKFGAMQCRHNDNPEQHNPFAPEREVSTGSGDFPEISYEKALNMQALARGGSGRGEIQIHGDSGGVEDNNVFGNDPYPDDEDIPFVAEIDPAAETASLTVNDVSVTDDDVTDGDANGASTGDPEWPGGVPSYIDLAINATASGNGVTTVVDDVEVNGSSVSTSISENDGVSYLTVTNVAASGTVTVEGTMRFEGDQGDYTSQDRLGIDFR